MRIPTVLSGLAVALAAFGLTFAVLRGDDPPPRGSAAAALPGGGLAAGDAAARIARLQAALRGGSREAAPYVALAGAYLQRARETTDPRFYAAADAALAAALERRPGDPSALVERGVLRLARHDFAGALADARRARAAAPSAVRPLGVLVDALAELGRYGEARRALQTMIDRKPTLDAYTRVSYLRELHGDLGGARSALQLAVAAGGGAPENGAFALSLLGDLELLRGRAGAARRDYRQALAQFPGHAPAVLGLARLDLAAGRPAAAVARLRPAVARRPLTAHVIALGEAELLLGRTAAARRDLAVVRAEQRLQAAAGVDTDADAALFEADHGSPARAVMLARRAWRSAPSVRSADALGWALTRAGSAGEGWRWARRALALGSRDPRFLLHAGFAARAAGHAAAARPLLARGAETGRGLAPLLARDAERSLGRWRA